jgi:hypothetical protein
MSEHPITSPLLLKSFQSVLIIDFFSWVGRPRDKDICEAYFFFQLRSRSLHFLSFLLSFFTFIVFPVEIIFVLNVFSSPSTSGHAAEVRVIYFLRCFFILLALLLGWRYIYYRTSFQVNVMISSFFSFFRNSYSSFTDSVKTLNTSDDIDSELGLKVLEVKKISTTVSTGKNEKSQSKTSSIRNRTGNNQNDKHHQTIEDSYLQTNSALFSQQFFIFFFMLFCCLFFISSSFLPSYHSCAAYSSTFFNQYLFSCSDSSSYTASVPSSSSVSSFDLYVFFLSPLIFSLVFRECFIELLYFYHVIVILLCFLAVFVSSAGSGVDYVTIVLIACWSIGGALVLKENHVTNVAMFIMGNRSQLALEEQDRKADEKSAAEMRHMIGNVAHDLKTVSIIIIFCICMITFFGSWFLVSCLLS